MSDAVAGWGKSLLMNAEEVASLPAGTLLRLTLPAVTQLALPRTLGFAPSDDGECTAILLRVIVGTPSVVQVLLLARLHPFLDVHITLPEVFGEAVPGDTDLSTLCIPVLRRDVLEPESSTSSELRAIGRDWYGKHPLSGLVAVEDSHGSKYHIGERVYVLAKSYSFHLLRVKPTIAVSDKGLRMTNINLIKNYVHLVEIHQAFGQTGYFKPAPPAPPPAKKTSTPLSVSQRSNMSTRQSPTIAASPSQQSASSEVDAFRRQVELARGRWQEGSRPFGESLTHPPPMTVSTITEVDAEATPVNNVERMNDEEVVGGLEQPALRRAQREAAAVEAEPAPTTGEDAVEKARTTVAQETEEQRALRELLGGQAGAGAEENELEAIQSAPDARGGPLDKGAAIKRDLESRPDEASLTKASASRSSSPSSAAVRPTDLSPTAATPAAGPHTSSAALPASPALSDIISATGAPRTPATCDRPGGVTGSASSTSMLYSGFYRDLRSRADEIDDHDVFGPSVVSRGLSSPGTKLCLSEPSTRSPIPSAPCGNEAQTAPLPPLHIPLHLPPPHDHPIDSISSDEDVPLSRRRTRRSRTSRTPCAVQLGSAAPACS